ncbi:MAG: hypothetical protein O4808_04215 [Trichodesmium sp. St17_bin3_1_1]|nr:hypothetical protein [Trichodesmium sp. St17_bin3_1_1]
MSLSFVQAIAFLSQMEHSPVNHHLFILQPTRSNYKITQLQRF